MSSIKYDPPNRPPQVKIDKKIEGGKNPNIEEIIDKSNPCKKSYVYKKSSTVFSIKTGECGRIK